MKETTLRNMIRKQIKESLKEAPIARQAVDVKLGSVEKMTGVKALKKVLGQGTPAQQAAGLLKVVQAISGDDPVVGKALARMLMKSGVAGDEAPVAENKALAAKMAKVDDMDAMKRLKTALAGKGSNIQGDFVIDLIKGLGIDDQAKRRIRQNIKDIFK